MEKNVCRRLSFFYINKKCYFYNFLTNFEGGKTILHYIDGTCVEMLKTKKIRSNNRSGCTGVCFDKASKKWRAEIMLKGKRKCLGKFKYKRDAVKARKTAEEELHQKFILEHT